jgi:hypothetical protein
MIFGNGLRKLCIERILIPLRGEPGAYLFLIEMVMTKYLADAYVGSRRILPSRQTAGAEFPKYAGK